MWRAANLTMSNLDAAAGLFCLYVEEEQVERKRVCVWALTSDGAQLQCSLQLRVCVR